MEQCLQPTMKHGDSNMQVWCYISAAGVGQLIKIDGRLTSPKNKELIKAHAIPPGVHLICNNVILQPDNEWYTSRVVKLFLEEQHTVRITRAYLKL